MARQRKPEYVIATLRRLINKEEIDLKMWRDIIDNPNSDALSLRQAKGNISSTEGRIQEMIEVLSIIDPQEETK